MKVFNFFMACFVLFFVCCFSNNAFAETSDVKVYSVKKPLRLGLGSRIRVRRLSVEDSAILRANYTGWQKSNCTRRFRKYEIQGVTLEDFVIKDFRHGFLVLLYFKELKGTFRVYIPANCIQDQVSEIFLPSLKVGQKVNLSVLKIGSFDDFVSVVVALDNPNCRAYSSFSKEELLEVGYIEDSLSFYENRHVYYENPKYKDQDNDLPRGW